MAWRRVGRTELVDLAARWHDPHRDGSTSYLLPGSVPRVVLPDGIRDEIGRSPTGAVLFSSPKEVHVVLPPFPVTTECADPGWLTEPLVELVTRPRRVGVLLLRLGGYAVGVYDDERLVSSKVGERFVKGRHRKGGSSQARFSRRREEQARALFRKACSVLEEKLSSYERSLEHVLVGGDRRTLRSFEKECGYLRGLAGLRIGRRLDVREPKRATLDALPRQLYESRVLSLIPGDDEPDSTGA